MSERMRIGEALVACGAITEQQLELALAAQKKTPRMPLGLVLTEQFDVAVDVVDQVNVQSVLLPRFRKNFMSRLLSLSRGDKFARGLDIISFVTSVSTVAQAFEVGVCKSRQYTLNGTNYERMNDGQGFATRMDILVTVTVKGGGRIVGAMHAEHTSQTGMLLITDDEARIKELFYYEVRSAFRSLA